MRLFYCFAVPRSGTTFFGKLLNSHSQILCGHERFSPGNLKREYLSRDGFLHAESKRVDAKEMEALLSMKTDLLAMGDKLPRGYLHTTNLMQEIPDACFFAILRDTRQIGASWNRRAANPRDSWPTGMVSIFANIEFLIFAFALHTLPEPLEVRLLGYDYLVSPETMEACAERICGALGTEPDASMRRFIERMRAAKRPPSSSAWSEYDEKFFDLAPVSTLLNKARAWAVQDRAAVGKYLADFVAGFRQEELQIIEILHEGCEAAFAENPSARQYFRRMQPTYLRAARSMHCARFLRKLNAAIDA